MDVPITFFAKQDIFDVSDEKVYEFLTDVLDEVIELFPSKVIHIGGDEVIQTHWKESDKVLTYMKENNLKTTGDLQTFFINRISKYLESKGRRMMGWNEILGHNIHDYLDQVDTKSIVGLAPQSVVNFWKGDLMLLKEAVQRGFDVVNSLHSSTYLSYEYKDLSLEKAYSFNPVPIDLPIEFHKKIIGSGCHMWGEWIPTTGEMHFLTFPRIAAFAEVGWTKMENKSFENFHKRLDGLKKLWKEKKIYFATEEGIQEVNTVNIKFTR